MNKDGLLATALTYIVLEIIFYVVNYRRRREYNYLNMGEEN
jgi:hypothetical protein